MSYQPLRPLQSIKLALEFVTVLMSDIFLLNLWSVCTGHFWWSFEQNYLLKARNEMLPGNC